jgi:hypothetical protein
MLYGMTGRLPWTGDPRPLWKAWDDFGIKGARMIGYWVPDSPVKTDNKDVLATVYVRNQGSRTGASALVSVASWAEEQAECRLIIDWKRLGISPQKARISAPPIEKFQEAAIYKPGDPIPVSPGKGLLLIVKEAAHESETRQAER